MKILCLHGALGSAENFKVQLSPFLNAVGNTRCGLEFRWINGGHPATPPEGYDDYFGGKDLYRFVNFDGSTELEDMLEKIRQMPEGQTAEDTMRNLAVGSSWAPDNINMTLDRLFRVIDEDPEIEGVLGYSEGATVAATLILEEQRRCREDGRVRRLKLGVFFSGWPPVLIGKDRVDCVLADELEDFIEIPTLHIVGSKDPYIHGAVALFNICEMDNAILFDHGQGHALPRDERTVKELSVAIDNVVDLVGQFTS